MPPKMKFQEGEQVLCFHGPLLYEAKCVKAEMRDKTLQYFVHYNGWNKNWDEWVPESRVLKFNDTGLQKQKELQKAHAVKAKAARSNKAEKEKEKEKDREKHKEKDKEEANDGTKGRGAKTPTLGRDRKSEKDRGQKNTPLVDSKRPTGSAASSTASDHSADNAPLIDLARKKRTRQSDAILHESPSVASTDNTPAPATSSEPPKKKRARVDPTVELQEAFVTKIEVRIKIPDELKPWLVDDWDLVTRQKQLVTLPCKTTVENILEDYSKMKLAKPNHSKDAVIEVTQGIKEYFNVMLGTQLLYKFERQQYSEVLAKHPELRMSQIYGATHLLRLFVKLGGMLSYTPLDEKCMQLLLNHLHDFLKYMARSMNNLFSVSDYSVASPDYQRKAV